MNEIRKPDLTRVWASTADKKNKVDPDDTTPGKFETGWGPEIPTFEHFNYLQNHFTKSAAYLNQQGIAEYDKKTDYPRGAFVKARNNAIYLCVIDNGPSTGIIDEPLVSSQTSWLLSTQDVAEYAASGDYYDAAAVSDTKYEASPLPMRLGLSQLIPGTKIRFKVPENNVGPCKLNVSSTGYRPLVADGKALIADDLIKDKIVNVTYDGNDWQLDVSHKIIEPPEYKFDLLEGENGYQKLPSGLIIQWVTLRQLGYDESRTVILPIAYNKIAFGCWPMLIRDGATVYGTMSAHATWGKDWVKITYDTGVRPEGEGWRDLTPLDAMALTLGV